MKLTIAPAALLELQEAADFYSAQAGVGLAQAFLAEFERSVTLILGSTQLGSVFRGKRRRYALRRFPYDLIYQLTPGEVRVIAVAHQRRRPGYWQIRK
ncbi:type II toxin-antitoxin system RelE/ParE family toxin [Duganella sp. 3397]|uniref:type II toxin-antitoxin system RelE/ParE family toxin n=2 Tax=Duganella TaxID=75654 RepID=UPI0038576F44